MAAFATAAALSVLGVGILAEGAWNEPIWGVGGVVAVLCCAYAAALLVGLLTDPRRRARRRLRRVTVQGAPPGEDGCVALRGRVRAARTVVSPYGRSACVYYWTSTVSDGDSEPPVDTGGEAAGEFELVCAGQVIAIDTRDAIVLMSRAERSTAAAPLREYVILPDDEVIVLGHYSLAAEDGVYRGTARMAGEGGRPLVVATPRALTERILS